MPGLRRGVRLLKLSHGLPQANPGEPHHFSHFAPNSCLYRYWQSSIWLLSPQSELVAVVVGGRWVMSLGRA